MPKMNPNRDLKIISQAIRPEFDRLIELYPDLMRRIKILIVDDDSRFTGLVKTTLEGTGKYEVWEDNEGTKALDKAREIMPDMVLLDIQMPKTSGTVVAQRLRSDAALLNTPIIYLTGIVPKEDYTLHKDLGGVPFIAKPIGLRELIDCIDANLPDEKRIR